jgi:hypothetical protein
VNKRDELVMNAVSGKRANSKGWVRANCPFCELKTGKSDKKLCLGLRVDIGKWHCFRCGSGGLLFASQEELEALGEMRPSVMEADDQERAAMEPPDGFVELFDGHEFSFPGDFMRDYLTGTGFTEDGQRKRELPEATCREARVGAVFDGCGGGCEPRCIRCKIRGRIVVPIFDVGGDAWLGWSARSCWKDATRKYLYPPGMRRAEIMYNQRALHVETDVPAYVVEGVFDSIALWPDGVAVLGKVSREQEEALMTAKRPVVSAFDGDAWREGRALAQKLRHAGVRSGYVRLASGVDPDEVPRDVLDRYAAESLEA